MAGAPKHFAEVRQGLAMTDEEVEAWNMEIAESETRHNAKMEKIYHGRRLLDKLVMPEYVATANKYSHLPSGLRFTLWEQRFNYEKNLEEEQAKAKAKVEANANAKAQAKAKIKKFINLKRRPEERSSTWQTRQQEHDDQVLRAMLAADPSIPRIPDEDLELLGICCPASSSQPKGSE